MASWLLQLTTMRDQLLLLVEAEGTAAAVAGDPALAHGVNVVDGQVVLPEVAEAHGMSPVGLGEVLS